MLHTVGKQLLPMTHTGQYANGECASRFVLLVNNQITKIGRTNDYKRRKNEHELRYGRENTRVRLIQQIEPIVLSYVDDQVLRYLQNIYPRIKNRGPTDWFHTEDRAGIADKIIELLKYLQPEIERVAEQRKWNLAGVERNDPVHARTIRRQYGMKI